jgi:biopolymer transport protein ExbD
VRRDEMDAELQRLRSRNAATSIAVRGDRRVKYGEVIEVLGACRAAGWEDVKLVSLRPRA